MEDTEQLQPFDGLLSTDAPRSKDEPDILGHETLVETIAEIIRKQHEAALLPNERRADTPESTSGAQACTIGISGPWGSGKTSILNAVERALAPSRPHLQQTSLTILSNLNTCPAVGIQVMRFDPWLISGGAAQLTAEFLSMLSKEVDPSEGWRSELSEALSTYQSALELADASSVPGIAMSLAGKLIQAGSQAYTAKRGDLNALRARVSDLLQQGKVTYVVMIDDLDRLTPPDILTVFQMIRCIANFPNVLYLVAYDQDMVAAAIDGYASGRSVAPGEQQQKDSATPEEYGSKYLEKIIQVPLIIPRASPWMIEQQLLPDLRKIPGFELGGRWQAWRSVLTTEISTLRMAKRLISTFTINYNHRFATGLWRDDADPFMILGLTTLEVLWPDIYNKAVGNRRMLLSSDQSKRNETIDSITQEDGPPRKLLKLMFDTPELPYFGYLDFDAPGQYYPDSYLHEIILHGTHQAFADAFKANYLQILLNELADVISANNDPCVAEHRAALFRRFFESLQGVALDCRNNPDKEDEIIAAAQHLFATLRQHMASEAQCDAIKKILDDHAMPRFTVKFWNMLNGRTETSNGLAADPSGDLVEALGADQAEELHELAVNLSDQWKRSQARKKHVRIIFESWDRDTADQIRDILDRPSVDVESVPYSGLSDTPAYEHLDGVVALLRSGRFTATERAAPPDSQESFRVLKAANDLSTNNIAVCGAGTEPERPNPSNHCTFINLPDGEADAARFERELYEWIEQIG